MGRIYLIRDAADIARRLRLLPPDQLVDVWPDVEERDHFWVGAASKAALGCYCRREAWRSPGSRSITRPASPGRR